MIMIQMKLDQQAFSELDQTGQLATLVTSSIVIVALRTTIPGLTKLTLPWEMPNCI